jgi:putative oxidoreductase
MSLESRLSNYQPLSNLVFRISLSLIFIVGGLGHFGRHDWMLERLEASPWLALVTAIGSPSVLLWLSGAVMVFAGFGLLTGLLTRLSALALFVTLVPITFVVHVAPDHVGPLLKNVAILGGLFHYFIHGGGDFSLDRRLS